MKISLLLTYRDRAGKLRLRDYVKVTLGILVLVVVVSTVGLYNQHEMVSQVMATPRPLDDALIPTTTEPTSAPTVAVETCPSDPRDWTLTDNATVPGSNLKGLLPQCVGEQLEKTAAWFYATSVLGYGRKAAADTLGFSTIPMEYQFDKGGITVLTDFKDEPQHVDLRFPSDNKGLREWRTDASIEPAVEFTFSGCFRTSSMSGGNVNSWGDGYPVVCQYFGDYRTKHLISEASGNILTINGSQNVRRPMWFGYTPDGYWLFLGDAPDWDVELANIPNHGPSTVNATVMSMKYGISSQSLPENWSIYTGQEYVDAFLRALNESN